jgi:hypothetical protein
MGFCNSTVAHLSDDHLPPAPIFHRCVDANPFSAADSVWHPDILAWASQEPPDMVSIPIG